ncbi:MAG: alpha/beta fold hydrolase [Pseudomonadales bacterium]|nr:alpha/beta fold hydrolase [Pseudomonadales bacterium]
MQSLNQGGWVSSLNDVAVPKARLVCFCHEGGSADYFASWVEALRDDVEIVAVQLPGRADRANETPLDNVHDVVEELVNSESLPIDKPYLLFGHSLGATLAFETLTKLNELGLPMPKRIILSGRQAPSDVGDYFQKMAHLDDQDFFEDLVNDDCLSQWVLKAPEEVAKALPYIRADFQMLEDYIPSPIVQFNIPIEVFAGSRDSIPLGNLLEWQKASRHPVHVCVFKGAHGFIDEDRASVLNHIKELFNELIVSSAYA